MTPRVQYVSVLAGLLISLALTIGLAGSPPPVPGPAPAGGDPTWDVPTLDAKTPGARPQVPASIVPEGVAVLLLTIVWTACRALLSGRLGLDAFRRVVASPSHRRSFGWWRTGPGYTDDALGRHGVLDPEIILLSKPFTPESLMRHLRRALDASAKRD